MSKALWAAAFGIGLAGAAPAFAEDPCADWVPQAKPQNASRDDVGQDLDRIMERGYLTVAVYEDFPPYSFLRGDEPAGVDVEIGRLIAEELGVEARFSFVDAGENLDADLRDNVWKGPLIGGAARVSNMMMRVPYDSAFACRVEQVVFTGQYMTETLAIAYDSASYPEEKPVPAYFRFDTVAVETDSISDFYLSNFAGGQMRANVKHYPTMRAAMAALEAGEVMAAMGPRSQIDHSLTDAMGVHEPPLPGLAKSKWTLGVGINFRYRPLAYSVDDAIYAALQDGRVAAIFDSYGLTFTPPER